MTRAGIVFHLPARHLENWRETRHLRLFARIEAVFAPLGARIAVADRRARPFQAGETAAYDDGDLHIIDTGRARGAGVLNASIAYLPPFWHLDPLGMQAESSIAGRVFDPAEVPARAAAGFFERMRGRYTLQRRSRRAQEEAEARFAPGAIAVFLQGSQPEQNGLAYLTGREMLRAVAQGAGGRQVLVKPHPLAPDHDAGVIAEALAEGLALTPTTANVHDIIAASVATVSVNSACALEGFLQRKPAILCGPSDFHHAAHTLRRPEAFAAALARALAPPVPEYERFLYWYFVRNCVNLGAPDFATKVEAIFTAAGFPPARLGIGARGA